MELCKLACSATFTVSLLRTKLEQTLCLFYVWVPLIVLESFTSWDYWVCTKDILHVLQVVDLSWKWCLCIQVIKENFPSGTQLHCNISCNSVNITCNFVLLGDLCRLWKPILHFYCLPISTLKGIHVCNLHTANLR